MALPSFSTYWNAIIEPASRIKRRQSGLVFAVILITLQVGRAEAFTLVDFTVDPAHAGPPRTVFFPDFNNFELCITGTFDPSKCYQVKIERSGGAPCGSANNSGTDKVLPNVDSDFPDVFCNVLDVTSTSIRADISPNAMSSFKKATNWKIVVSERSASCSGSSTTKTHPKKLTIAGCNDTCLLKDIKLSANPSTTNCSGQTQLCSTGGGTGNLMYEWDTDGDGQTDDLTTFAPVNCINVIVPSTRTLKVKVTDLGTNVDCDETDAVNVKVAPNNCNDNNPCTDDTCAPGGGCVFTPDDSNSCADSLYCNGAETCQAGSCVSGAAPDCDDGVTCTTDSCDESDDTCNHTPVNGQCSNGLYCDGLETCHVTLGCQDNADPCTLPLLCDENSDSCVACLTNVHCDNGLHCDGTEACVNGVCQPGNPPNCSDGIPCTVDSCDESTDSCAHAPNDAGCQNGAYCDGQEVCHPANGCQDAHDPCGTPLHCNEMTDMCVSCLTDEHCNNGAHCDGVEVCVNGTCQAGTPPDCDDGIACTIDACNESTDSCDHTPDHAPCQNGTYCDGAEVCNPASGCADGADPCGPPTFCDENSDTCVNCLTNGHCDDGLHCNGAETCVNGNCASGTVPNCDDAIACTLDSCNEATDSCDHAPQNQLCDNGLHCDGMETCHANNGCVDGADPCGPPQFCAEATDTCVQCLEDAHCDDGQHCNGLEACIDGACENGTAVNCDDGIACTIDSCNEATDSCDFVPQNNLCGNGLFCDGAETCDPAQGCIDVADPCSPPSYCDESSDNCVECLTDVYCSDGLFCNGAEVCVNGLCQSGTSPNCDDAIACTVDSCNELIDQCTHGPEHSLCSDGNACTDDTCDPALGCVFTPDDSNACTDGNMCSVKDACVGGTCVGTPLDCSGLETDCTIGVCNLGTGVCESLPTYEGGPCNDGLFCTMGDVCVSGTCTGTPRNCDDGVSCTVDACDEMNKTCTHAASDNLCDDAEFCNGAETCHPVNGCMAGDPPCGDAIACTIDTCDEVDDACIYTPEDSLCQNGQFCDGMEVCDANLGCQDGPDPNCDDGVACTIDTCDEAADQCDYTPDNNACSNGLFCDGAEICDVLSGCQDAADPCLAPLFCDESTDTCVECLTSATCDDGLYCNGSEQCVNFQCAPGTPVDCADGIACTTDLCDESADVCQHVPIDSTCQNGLYCDGMEVCNPVSGCEDGADPCMVPTFCNETTDTCDDCLTNEHCDDGLFCNGTETCVAGNCAPGTPPDCSDGFACTLDNCNESADACDHVSDDNTCDDGLFCNGVETCDVLSGCVNATDPCQSPSICDEATDSCVQCMDDAQCQDGLFCNGEEVCVNNACVPGAAPCPSDNVACTIDACDEMLDVCLHTPDNNACSDGQFCNGMEICDPLNGCQPGVTPCMPDGVACTLEACDEVADLCTQTAEDLMCDDGLFCNGAEICNPLLGCQPGDDPCSDDGVPCTAAVCDETLDACTETLNDAMCDDGVYCNGMEICTSTGCADGVDPCAPDSVPCTDDVCNEKTDQCEYVPNNSLCNDGLFCNGVESCDPLLGCEAGAAPCQPDGVACTDDVCDEATDSCMHITNDLACDDGLFCNGTEVCDPVNGCIPSANRCPPDNIGCTTDDCDEANDVCVHQPDDALCEDANECTADICDPGAGGCRNEDSGMCGACCLPNECNDQLLPETCVGLGGTFSSIGSSCASDSDGDGVGDPCDLCPGVDDAQFGPACAGAIPTVSHWGLLVLSLLLLVGSKLAFQRRRII